MKSLSSNDKNVKLCVIDISNKYALKDKEGKTALNAFMEIANESNRKPNKLWADPGK